MSKGYSAKEKLAALVLSGTVVASGMSNTIGLIPANAETSDPPETRPAATDSSKATDVNATPDTLDVPTPSIRDAYTISVVDERAYTIEGAETDATALVAKGNSIQINASGTNWGKISKLEIVCYDYEQESVVAELDRYNPTASLNKTGLYSVRAISLDKSIVESTYFYEFVNFNKISYDETGVTINRLRLGLNGDDIVEGKWYLGSDLQDLYFDVISDVTCEVGSVYAIINGTRVTAQRSSGNSYIISKDSLTSKLGSGTSLGITVAASNSYGSTDSKSTSFSVDTPNDDAKVSVVKIYSSDGDTYNPYVLDNNVYLKPSTGIMLSVKNPPSGAKCVKLFRRSNAQEITTYNVQDSFNGSPEWSTVTFNNAFQYEDSYYVEVEYLSGYKCTYDLFDGKVLKYDGDAPNIESITFKGSRTLNGWYNSDGELKITVSDVTGASLKYVRINGNEYVDKFNVSRNGNTYEYTIDSSIFDLSDGTYTIDYKFTDALGWESGDLFRLRFDKSVPSVKNNGALTVSINDKNIHVVNTDIVSVDGEIALNDGSSFYDAPSGIKYVRYYEDRFAEQVGDYVERYSDYFQSGVLNCSSVDSSDIYEGGLIVDLEGIFVVSDKAGNTSRFTVRDLIKAQKGLDNPIMVVDTDDPVVSYEGADLTPTSTGYYLNTPTLSFKANDSNLSSVWYTINSGAKNKLTISDTGNYEFKLPTDEGTYRVDFYAEDIVGKSASVSTTIIVDKTDPKLSAETTSVPVEYGGKQYFTKGITISARGADTFGISKFQLLQGNDVIETNVNGVFNITQEGSYSIDVCDNAGRHTTKSLKDLLGWGSNDICFDLEAPKVEGVIKSSTIYSDWYADKVEVEITATDNIGIKVFTASVNGTSVPTSNGKVVIDTSLYSPNREGYYEIKAAAEDIVGKRTDMEPIRVRVDSDNPSFVGVSIETPKAFDGTGYYSSDSIPLTIRGTDSSSGVKGYYLINKTTGDEVYSPEGSFSIEKAGVYEVVIEDLVGHKVTKPLSELAGWSFNYISFDTDAPVVSVSRDKASSYGDWYLDDQKFNISASDNVAISSLVVTVNGVAVKIPDDLGDSYSFSLNTSDYKADRTGKFIVKATVTDPVGRTVNSEDFVLVDRDPPVIDTTNVVIPTPAVVENGTAFFSEGYIDIKVPATDRGSGIKKYHLYGDNGVDLENDTGSFRISKGGSYTIEVYDNLDRKVVSPIGNLANWGTNVVDFDASAPVISHTREGSPAYGNDWFSGDVNYTLSATDDKGIQSFRAYVNNTEFVCRDLSNPILKVSTTGIDPKEGSKYEIRAIVKDVAGKEYTWSDTIYIDTGYPTLGLIKIDTPAGEFNNRVFFSNSSVNLEVKGMDSQSGVKSYTLSRNGTDLLSNADGKFAITEAGSYYVTVEDKVGRKVTKALSELTGWSSNNLDFDLNAPTVTGGRVDKPVFDNWYKSDTSWSIDVNDNMGIKKSTVYLNGAVVDSFNPSDLQGSKRFVVSTKGRSSQSDGSYTIRVVSEDVVGLTSEWSDTIKIDRSTPTVTDFVVSGNIQTLPGKYKYIFDGAGKVQVNVADGAPSSGIDSIYVKTDGDWVRYATNGGTVAYVDIPANYKGSISAYAVDKVGNKGSELVSDGFMSEDSNTSRNYSSIVIDMGNSGRFDSNNLPLYGGDVNVDILVECNWAGIKSLEWGIGSTTLGSTTDFSSASRWDGNLPLSFNTSMVANQEGKSQEVWIKVVDLADHVSESRRKFSIDKTAPSVRVDYDVTNSNGYYSGNRTATITVNDANFSADGVSISGTYGNMSDWSRSGNSYIATLHFVDEGDYNFSVSATDAAGNSSAIYNSGEFTIDKTRPTLSVAWDSNNSSGFYNGNRTATISVKDINFNPSMITITGGQVGNWYMDGNIHKVDVRFSSNGNLYVTGRDLAGNSVVSSYTSEDFIIDKGSPNISISGISEGVSYKNDVGFFVDISDTYLDTDNSYVELSGNSHSARRIGGRVENGKISVSYTDFPKEKSTDDRYTLYVYAVDKAGNVSKESLSFTVNRAGSSFSADDSTDTDSRGRGSSDSSIPGVKSSTDSNKGRSTVVIGGYNDTASKVKISETNLDDVDTTKTRVVVTKDGREIDIPDDKIKITKKQIDGRTVVDYEIDEDQFTEDGNYNVQIFSETDDGTENSTAGEEYEFVVDTTPPEIIVSGAEDGAEYTGDSRRVSFDIRDLSGVETLQITLNGKAIEYQEVDGLYIVDVPASDEPQTLFIKVIDKAGNESTMEVKNFTVTADKWDAEQDNSWWKYALTGIGAAVLILVGVLLGHRRKVKKEEDRLARENEEYYSSNKSSSSGSSNSSSSGGSSSERVRFMSDESGFQTEPMSETDIQTDVMGETGFQTEMMDETGIQTDLMD